MTSKSDENIVVSGVNEVIAPIPVKRYFCSPNSQRSSSRSTLTDEFEMLTEDEIQKDFNSIKSKSEIHLVQDEIISILTRSEIQNNEFQSISKVKSNAF